VSSGRDVLKPGFTRDWFFVRQVRRAGATHHDLPGAMGIRNMPIIVQRDGATASSSTAALPRWNSWRSIRF